MDSIIIQKENYLVDKQINGVLTLKELSDEEFQDLKNAGIQMHEFLHYQRRYKTFESNYKRFFQVYNHYENEVIQGNRSTALIDESFIEINTALINLVSTFASLVTILERDLKNKYNIASKEYLSFKSFLNYSYDSNFSYKFLYHLRNYSLHSNFPIKIFGYKRDRVGGYSFYAEFERDEILKDPTCKEKLKNDLSRFNKTFPVKPHVENIIKPFDILFKKLIEIQAGYFDQSAELILGVSKAFRFEGKIALGKYKSSDKGHGWNTIDIPVFIVDEYYKFVNS